MLAPSLREDAEEIITAFIGAKVEEAGAAGVLLGLSGGLDSSVLAYLCVRALGRDKVLAVMMPEGRSYPLDFEHGLLVAKELQIDHVVVDITPPSRSFLDILPEKRGRLAEANIRPRCRMVILYFLANSNDYLVMGASNKSELLMGYFTKWGDGAADFLPMGDLYKTQVRAIAGRLRVPSQIIEKPPSAGLWEGQTDESEMGISYDLLDRILYGLEIGLPAKELSARLGCDPAIVAGVKSRVAGSSHKRRMPPIPKLGLRTPGFDWREI